MCVHTRIINLLESKSVICKSSFFVWFSIYRVFHYFESHRSLNPCHCKQLIFQLWFIQFNSSTCETLGQRVGYQQSYQIFSGKRQKSSRAFCCSRNMLPTKLHSQEFYKGNLSTSRQIQALFAKKCSGTCMNAGINGIYLLVRHRKQRAQAWFTK